MNGVNDLAHMAMSLPLVDHHVHGTLRRTPAPSEFETLITEGDHPGPPGQTQFDSQVGFAIRRWCAPLLGLDPWCSAQEYLARRTELGEADVSRRLVAASGTGRFLLDTGFASGEVLDPVELQDLVDRPTHEIVRLESVLESLALSGAGAEQIWTDFSQYLAERTTEAVGLKSIMAYRYGFDFDPARPTRGEVVSAADEWLRQVERGGQARVTHPDLLRFALWTGVDRGLPVQLHTGYGDADLDLHRCNPTLLSEFFRNAADVGTAFTLLHCYPYHREAGYLAQVFPSVYFDVGLGVHFSGARAYSIIAESLELAPFHKILFSSDAWGPAELHFLGAHLWRRGMSRVLTGFVNDDEWHAAEASRVLTMIGRGNAERLYGIGEASS